MAHDFSFSRLVAILKVSWKLALILALFSTQMGLLQVGVTPASAAPERGLANPAPVARPNQDAYPAVSVSAGDVQLGSDFTIHATFTSTGDSQHYGAIGYGPFIDLYIPHTGPDGTYPGGTPANRYDGISPAGGATVYSATYLGLPLTVYTLNFTNTGTACPIPGEYAIDHPLALDEHGIFTKVCGKPGDQLVVIQLPFGSFTPGQPSITVQIPAHLSLLADVGSSLAIKARAGFEFGATPMVDWCCTHPTDTTILSDGDDGAAWHVEGNVHPQVFSFTKSGGANTATGPNYPHTYTLTVDIAKGQAVSGIDITDTLPDNIYYLGSLQSTPSPSTIVHQPAVGGPYAGEHLNLHFNSITGDDGPDILVTFDYYIPQLDSASNPIIPPMTGIPATTTNSASASGTWTPVDTRDAPAAVSGTGVGTGSDRPLVVSKGSAIAVDTGQAGATPGDIIQYTVDFSVSDYFALDNLIATDVIGDGQHFFTDGSHVPQLVIHRNGSSNTHPMTNYSIACDYTGAATLPAGECNSTTGGGSGTTTATFNISGELNSRGLDPQLLGGLVPDGDPANDGATTGQVIFFTRIQDKYSDQFGKTNIKQGDSFTDTVNMVGRLLDVGSCEDAGHNPQSCSPYSGNPTTSAGGSSGQTVPEGALVKSIYAYNGTVCTTQPCANVNVAPGDTVTYRIRYDLVTGDFAGLNLTDFLPLPIFKANDPNFDGSDLATWLKYPGLLPAPDPGTWMYGLADTHHSEASATDPLVSISGASANNSATFDFGSFDDPLNQPAVIDLLFTVRVTRDPYADGLQMTNEAQQRDANSPGAVSTTDKISQLTLTEPVLVSKKSVVSTNHSGITPTPPIPGPIVFAPPWDGSGPDPQPWSGGPINSTYLGSTNSALNSGVNGIDGSDLVKFAIVIQNTGSSPKGAFDITIKDTLPSGYVLPGNGAEGINLQVFRGDGTEFVLDNPSLDVNTYIELAGGLLGSGIQIVDPKSSNPAYGHGACQLHDAASGNNVILVTYDLKVDPNDAPGSQIENHGQLTHYSGSEGGPTYLPQPQDNPTDSTLANPTLAKTLVGTEIDNSTTTHTNGPTQAVIGELASYRLAFTIPEGSSPHTLLTDTLPAGLAFVGLHLSNPADPSSYFTNSDAAQVSFTGSQAPLITNNGRTVSFNLGTVINTDNHNDVPETLTWQYDAVVLNIATNVAGTTLTNSASMTWDRQDVQGHTVTGTSGPVSAQAVTVIEPNVDITKQVTPTSGDAADSFTYTITITGATITDAFDVTLEDAIPAQMTGLGLVNVTDSAGLVQLSNFHLIGNTLSTLTPFNMPVDPTRQIVLTLTGSVSYSVNPQQNVDNNAIVRWTSLSGAVSGRSTYDSLESNERTGLDGVGGALNDYAKAGLGRFTVTSVGATKIFITTSEAHTPDFPPPPQVAVGEIVRYRLVVPVPESTSPNFQVLDNLPTGMTFLNDGTAKLAFVSNGPGITSTGFGIVTTIPHNPCTVSGATVNATTPADPLPCSFAPGNIGSDGSTQADADAYTTGTDVYFKFGDLVNNDNDQDTEFVVLEFNALVDNNPAGGNLAGKNLDNNFNVYVNGGVNGLISNLIRVRVVEPAISMTKTANPTTGDAGDPITYSLAVSNTGTTTAFDVQVTDTAPLGITADMAGLTVSDPSSCAIGMDKHLSSGNSANVTFTSIPAGCTLTIRYTATVDYTVTASQVLTNTAHVTYSSLPGSNGTTSNPTGSTTPGASGTNTGERVYNGQASATFTINPVVPVKSIVATSDSHTAGNDLAIGEVLRYRLAVDIPEGTQLAFTIDDILPAGFTYAGNPMISFIDDSGMTLDVDLAGSSQADNNALPPTFSLPAGRVSNAGQHYTFTLGGIVNHDSDPGAERAVLEFDVQVNNDAMNNNTDTKANNFTVTIASQLRGTSNTVTATIVEPVLTVDKTIAHIDVTRDAGDTVMYQVSIAPDLGSVPGSTAYAYDVHFTDTLPGDLTFTPSSLVVTLNGGAATLSNNSSTNLVDITVGSIPNTIGTSVVLTFSATLKISVTPGELITNTADLTWTSLSGVDANERDGSLAPAFNDYDARSGAGFNVHDPAFSKRLMYSSEGSTADPRLTIGEVATFALKVTLPEGTTPALHIRDDIPLGLQVVPGSAAIITSAAGSYGLLTEDFNGTLPSMGETITPPGGSGDDVSFDFTNPITVAVDALVDPNNNSFLISFRSVVNNVSGNHSGISLPNSATLTVGSWTSTPPAVNVLVVEPKLLIQKTVDNDHPRLGDTITYTTTVQYDPASTAEAYKLVVTDTLPAGLLAPFHLTATSSPSNCAGAADTHLSAGATIDARVDHLPPACILTITYQSGIDTNPSNTPPIGTVLTNAAHLTWTSLPVVTADVRTGSGGSPNTYFADSGVPVTFANIDMVIGKSDGGTTAHPGGLITYSLHYQNAGDITATGVVLTDVIPPNTTFHAAGSTPGWSCADGAAAGTTCTFGIPSVPASASADELLVLQVDASVPDLVTSIVNTATIADDDTHGNEPTPSNNTSTDITPLDAAPDIAVAKTDGLDTVAPGETLPYVLTVSNTGNQDATGVAVTDTIPAHTTFVSAGDNPVGQAASFNSGTGVVSWPVFDLAAGHSITLTVTVTIDNLLPAGVSTLTNTAQAQDDGTNGSDSTLADNTATDVDNTIYVANSDLSKILVVDSLGATIDPDAAIGEVMTYHITFNVPPGWMNDLTLTDQFDLGLAFVDCESITPSSTYLTWQDPPAGGATDFSPICTSPAVSALGDPANPASPGRQVVFDFHNLHNGDIQTHSITVSVHAVVLDVVENVSGRNDLNNGVTLDWNGGSLTTSAPTPLQIVEPKLTLQKTGDKNTTAAGGVITFTLTVAYDSTASTADAYDVLLTDILPNGLTYVPASLQYVSGNIPNSATPPSLDDTSAPTLRVHWDAFPSIPSGQAVIQFQATLGNIGPGNSVTNSANVEWTSLPGVPPSPTHVPPLPAGQESIYNDTAHERRYDPLHAADVYSVSAAFQVSMPRLPMTGFTPEQTTLLPDQPADARYSDLGTLWLEIPSLGVKARIVGVPATSGAWDLTWLGDQIGYLYETSYPTWSGNSGLTGHVYLPNGKPGPLANLYSMIWGQQIIVHLAGQQYIFEVRSVRRVLPDDLSVLGHAATPTLTLITCQGYDQAENDYHYRVAVRAVLVQILPDN